MPTVAIDSPEAGTTVSPNFTATGTVSGFTPPIPNPPPLTVHINIDGVKTWATVTMNDSGGWTAVFTNVPTGARGTIKAVWTPTDESATVGPISVE
ncbi:MAG TPA: hypothetical protein VM597_34950 [Gemmataceae bacterium]|jgi:hypothetical protein|nr:hypothetical protein [Gemmataceae bacterium]